MADYNDKPKRLWDEDKDKIDQTKADAMQKGFQGPNILKSAKALVDMPKFNKLRDYFSGNRKG